MTKHRADLSSWGKDRGDIDQGCALPNMHVSGLWLCSLLPTLARDPCKLPSILAPLIPAWGINPSLPSPDPTLSHQALLGT